MHRLWVLTSLLLPIFVLNCGRSRDTSQDRRQFADFDQRLNSNPGEGLAYARKAVIETAHLSPYDRRRGDALEMLCQALARTDQTEKMLTPANELVRIRKAAQPPEYELEAIALGYNAVALFAADRAAESDQALRDSLSAYRRAFRNDDIKLAQKLESQAEFVQSKMGRQGWAIDLWKEAIALRLKHPDSSGGKLADTMEQLAMHQMMRGEISEPAANLQRAQELIGKEMQREPEREDNKAGLGEILALRSGIAGKLGQRDLSMSLAKQASDLTFQDRVLGVNNELNVADSLSITYEDLGDLQLAVDEQNRKLEVFRRNPDLVRSGDLDVRIEGDIYLSLAELQTKLENIGAARSYARMARQTLGDSEDVLFAESDIAHEGGDAATALRRYQEALNLRKEATAEVTVFYGTTRKGKQEASQIRFGREAAGEISYGSAAVLVPGAQFNEAAWHKAGSPAIASVGRSTDEEKLLIRKQESLQPAALDSAVRAVLSRARLYPGSVLVFVHGFNVSFKEAVQRAAQLVRDLNYDGPAFVFSWPSQERLLRYGVDRETADKSAESLAKFLQRVQEITGDAKINMVAHSMGNRVLLPALASPLAVAVRPRIGEVILAAPAVPMAECARWLDQLNQQGLRHFTLYASKVDLAMWAALGLTEHTVLAGHVPTGEPFLHADMDSIDISNAGEAFKMNHDVFASNPMMVEDMRQLLQKGIRPPDRRLPTLKRRGEYWYYGPVQP